MKIYIPTKGRPNRQETLSGLPAAVRRHAAFLVIEEGEYDDYAAAGYEDILLVHPKGLRIPGIRQWIVDQHGEQDDDPRLIMMDDDLKFFRRRTDHPGRFEKTTPNDVMTMLKLIHQKLEQYAQVSVANRQQAHRLPPYETHMARIRCLLAHDVEVLQQEGIRYDRLPLMEDFDVTLQLLQRGYATCSITQFIIDQGESNADGGCSTYRTPDMQAEAALGLEKLHPTVVKSVQRKTKSGWFGEQPRLDVRVQWQAAYEEGLKYRTALLKMAEGDETEDA